MASMEDLIATISGGLHAGQQGNDLKDLHAKLAQTLHPSIPPQPYRPSAPLGASPAHSTGPMPPPAPASSWNSPPPSGYLSGLNGLNGLNALGGSPSFASLGSGSPSGRQPAFVGQRETGFAVSPKPNNGAVQGHAQGQGQGQGQGVDGVGAEIPAPRPAQFGRERDIATGNGGANGNGYGVNGAEASGIPYHSAVLPSRASPKDTGGFDEDAFRPLWNEEDAKSWEAFNARK
ncbi:hypothetical protein JCM24511_02956 [Saitozyma sp. JCM 24511]|nr:hypothetical protein JCM24511_02956 [Saitozyma sp. JCM 24511]